MRMLMLTGAHGSAQLVTDLHQFREIAHRDPAAIIGRHELVFAIASHPKAKDIAPDGSHPTFDGIPLLCLCDLWDEETGQLECGEGHELVNRGD